MPDIVGIFPGSSYFVWHSFINVQVYLKFNFYEYGNGPLGSAEGWDIQYMA